MCGIAGFYTLNVASHATETLRRMSDTIAHRGPDARGEWFDAAHGIGLAHRRLAIIDLTHEGQQPMRSASGRYTIVFNGEIYNFLRIRADLESLGQRFRGHSDTEVMLAAFEQWGLQPSLRRFVGMFAFALWDAANNELTLVRDRLGKKPLYYCLENGRLIFGSELKALRAFPGFRNNIDRQALALYMRYLYVPSPYTIYEGVRKLEPAHYIRFGARAHSVVEIDQQCYWSAAEVQSKAAANAAATSVEDAAQGLNELLRDAVQLRMIADVPLGAFLSGGIDSSLVVAIMQAHSSRPVRTFTIGFDEAKYNEAEHARRVARHLGTDHTEEYLRPEETLAIIPKLPRLYDEPFADSSQIPTALVCAMARKHVTVALSGDGGDEGFGGYSRYAQARGIWGRISRVPPALRRTASLSLRNVPSTVWESLARPLRPLASEKLRPGTLAYRALRLADRLRSPTPRELYKHLMSYWLEPGAIVVGGKEPRTAMDDSPDSADIDHFVEQMMLVDVLTYLPDDILVKVDRASMGVALEVRAPLLDHRVLEFAWGLPLDLKLRGGRGKILLRKLLSRYLPEELFERPKAGFAVPIAQWLRGPLRDWAEDLLSERRLERDGYFTPGPVRRTWHAMLAGESEWTYGGELLWGVLMFQTWLEHQRQNPEAAPCDSHASYAFGLSAAS